MSKVAIKSENIVPYGGSLYVMDEFTASSGVRKTRRHFSVLVLRCANFSYVVQRLNARTVLTYTVSVVTIVEDLTTILGKYCLVLSPIAKVA
jgi:hypothetical protein